jgi:hypothetical protein
VKDSNLPEIAGVDDNSIEKDTGVEDNNLPEIAGVEHNIVAGVTQKVDSEPDGRRPPY